MRVISGTARGVKLDTLDGLDTRPTTDRVKEAVFSMIQTKLMGAVALDLFSGSGALGIEMLSRGAHSVTFVEKNPVLKPIITSNLNKTKLLELGNVISQDVYIALKQLSGQKFDIIIMDPPYLMGDVKKSLDCIAAYDLLKIDGIVVVEHAMNEPEILSVASYFESLKTKKYGKIGVTVFRRLL